jgi:hypothetical protein
MRRNRISVAVALVVLMALPNSFFASNHREAPITALDHKTDIADLYAFRSYTATQSLDKVTLIMTVDPLLEPANGPTWFPFDPTILYEIKVDNNRDAVADIVFQFRFTTQFQLPTVYTALAGCCEDGAAVSSVPGIPARIEDFSNPGLNLRQTYTAWMVKNGVRTRLMNSDGSPFFALPANAGPRTINYPVLFDAATYNLANGVSVFAGTVDDPFWIDLGAAFDTAKFRVLGSGVPGVLNDAEDSANQNFASDTVSGYAVNAIAIEVPIAMLTRTGQIEPSSSPDAVIGVWATTSRAAITIRRFPRSDLQSPRFRQVQRIANPLINELIIGIGSKDRFSMDQPRNDSQFASFFLDPPIVQIVNALYGAFFPGALTVPGAPRTDLLPLVTYAAPICPGCTAAQAGPVADLLRLNTGIPATLPVNQKRLGFIAGDSAGYPNGRRLADDVVDITLRVGVGGVLIPAFNIFPNSHLGDGVNVNDAPYRNQFPYLADCPDGRNRRHVDPGEPGGGPVD